MAEHDIGMTRRDIDMTRRDIDMTRPYSAMIMTSQYTIYKICFHSQNKYYNSN